MRKRRIFMLFVSAILVFSLAACSRPSADSGASSEGTSAVQAEPSSGSDAEDRIPAPGSKGSFDFVIGAGHGPAGFPYVSCATDVLVPEITSRAAELGYEIKFTEAMGGTLAPLADIFESTESGLMDFGLIALSLEPVKAQVLAYTNYLPFCMDDVAKSYELGVKLWQNNKEPIDTYFEQFNVRYLGLGGSTSSYQLLTKNEVQTMDDMKGMKIAAAGANLGFLENTGAVGVQSNLNEAYTSLQTGVYEGWIVFPAGVTSNKLEEVTSYYLKTGFGSSNVLALFVNLNTWDSLPAELQGVIQDVVLEAYGPACVARTIEEDAAAYELMQENGIKVSEISETERTKWMNSLADPAVQAIADLEAAGLPGKKIFTEYYEIAAGMGYDAPRKFGQ